MGGCRAEFRDRISSLYVLVAAVASAGGAGLVLVAGPCVGWPAAAW